MRKSVEILIRTPNTRLPISLYTDIRKLLKDPLTNRLRYGDYTKLIIRLLTNWVEDQKDAQARRRAEDRFPQIKPAPPNFFNTTTTPTTPPTEPPR